MSHQRRRPAREASSKTQRQPSLAQIRKRSVSTGRDRLDQRRGGAGQGLAGRVVVRVAMGDLDAGERRAELHPGPAIQEGVERRERAAAGACGLRPGRPTAREAPPRASRSRASHAASPSRRGLAAQVGVVTEVTPDEEGDRVVGGRQVVLRARPSSARAC